MARRTKSESAGNVKVHWVVADLRGPHKVLDPSVDVFDTYTEALNECANRGSGYAPLVLNPQPIIRELYAENVRLREENKTLRDAIKAGE